MRYWQLASLLLLSCLIFLIFKSWFLPQILTGGDLWYYYPDMLKSYSLYPYGWSWVQGHGLGGSAIPFLWINTTFMLPVSLLFGLFHLPWSIMERIGLLYPFLLLGIISPMLLFRKVFPENNFFLIAGGIYVLNTYSLLVSGGGQTLYALSYALVPLTLWVFVRLITTPNILNILLAGLILGVQITTDLRVGFMTLGIIFCYWVMTQLLVPSGKTYVRSQLVQLVLPIFLALLINAYWLFPLIVTHQNPAAQLDSAYTSSESVKFFSFAKFEDTFSLLHPNWPENIFGKVYFFREEFIFLPFLAFSTLLFISRRKSGIAKQEKVSILFFCFLALVGAFLGKGAQDLFGTVYIWLFSHMPGFGLFRDPTKWYTLVALSYSMLVPWVISQIYRLLAGSIRMRLSSFNFENTSRTFNPQTLFLLIILGYLLFLIRPAVAGNLGGTLQNTVVPPGYDQLAQMLSRDTTFYRTLWFPTTQRFGYSTYTHPALSSAELFHVTNVDSAVTQLRKPATLRFLSRGRCSL